MSDVVMSWKSHSGDRKAIGTSVDQGIASNVIMTIISAHNAMLEPRGLEIQKYGQSQKKQKLSGQQDFCRKNFQIKCENCVNFQICDKYA